MATITANFTTISTCESITGMVGNKPALDSAIKKEGNNSVSFNVTTNTTTGYGFSIVNFEGVHCRMWYTSITFPWMDTKANGGLRFYLKDNVGNYSYWNIGGSDTYFGGWINVCIFADSVPDSNSGSPAGVSQIVEMGMVINTTSSPRNVVNTWIDYLRFGEGLQVESAASEEFGMEEIFIADENNGYGIVEKIEGIYLLSGSIQFGNGVSTANCFFKDSNVDIKFTDKNVSSSLYKLYSYANSTGTSNTVFLNGSIKAAGPYFELDFADSNLTDFTFIGNSIAQCNLITLSDNSGHLLSTNTFNSCGEIFPNFTSFVSNIVSDTTGDNALVIPTGSNNIDYCTFLNNSIATLYTAGGTYYDSNNTYINNTYDVENDSAGDVTINATGVSNISSSTNSGGGTVTILNTKQLSFTVLDGEVEQTGYEWRLYEKHSEPGIIGSINLAGEETATSATQNYYYTYVSTEDNSRAGDSDLLSSYWFTEGSGNIVGDNVSTLDLTIEDTDKVTWIPSGGLVVDESTIITSPSLPGWDTIVEASQEFSVEMWIISGNYTYPHSPPSRIVAYSYSASVGSNFILGQDELNLDVRIRTSVTDNFGRPGAGTELGAGLYHVVMTRSTGKTTSIYINGEFADSTTDAGIINNWGEHTFALANDVSEDRYWLGTLYFVGVFDRELTPTEVTQNYDFGYLAGGATTETVLQIIHDGYEESLTYFELENSDKHLTINLTKEENL